MWFNKKEEVEKSLDLYYYDKYSNQVFVWYNKNNHNKIEKILAYFINNDKYNNTFKYTIINEDEKRRIDISDFIINGKIELNKIK